MSSGRRTTWLLLAAAAALGLAACRGAAGEVVQTGPVDEASAEPDPGGGDGEGTSADDVVAALDQTGRQLREAYYFERDRIADYEAALRLVESRRADVRALEERLPAAPLGMSSDEEAGLYEAMRVALDAWLGAIEDARVELEDRRAELEPQVAEWGGVGAPPPEYLAVLRADESAATRFGDACAAFLDAAGLTADCYPFLGPESGDTLDTTHEVVVGDLTLEYDEPGVDWVESVEGATISAGQVTTLRVGVPPTVTDPTELHRDPASPMASAIPWPDDLAAWYGQLPVDVLDEGEVVLRPNARTWSYVVLEGTDPERFGLVEMGEVGHFATGQMFEVVLWWTTIDDEQVVAVSDGRPDLSYEEHFEAVRTVLETLRVRE